MGLSRAMALPCHHLALLAFLIVSAAAVAAAQPATDDVSSSSSSAPAAAADDNSTPAGVGIKVSFRPRVAIVVGIFAMIFSLTFLLLMYAKFCHPSNPSAAAQVAVVAGAAATTAAAGNTDSAAAAAGVPKQVIESLPFFRFATLKGARQGMECSVCLARFDDADLLRLLPRCRHAFHLHCVDRWLQSSATCPLCRAAVDADDATLGLKYPSISSARIVLGADDDTAAGSGGRDLLDIFVERVPGGPEDGDDEEEENGEPTTTTAISSSSVPPPRPPGPIMDRHKHRIIVSDVVFKSRWSELNSADLIALDTQMLRSISMSSGRFVFDLAPDDSPPYYYGTGTPSNSKEKVVAAAAAAEEEEELQLELELEVDGIVVVDKEKEIRGDIDIEKLRERKRLLGTVVAVDARLLGGAGCGSGSASAATATARMISSGVRSMSEIVSLPRMRAAARERLAEEDNRRWLPIARRTARWFAGRAASRGHQQDDDDEEQQQRPVHVVAAEELVERDHV